MLMAKERNSRIKICRWYRIMDRRLRARGSRGNLVFLGRRRAKRQRRSQPSCSARQLLSRPRRRHTGLKWCKSCKTFFALKIFVRIKQNHWNQYSPIISLRNRLCASYSHTCKEINLYNGDTFKAKELHSLLSILNRNSYSTTTREREASDNMTKSD